MKQLTIKNKLPQTTPGPDWTGIYRISNEDYHSSPGLSKTILAKLAESPLVFYRYITREKDETRSKDLGDAVHAYILEPERFIDKFAGMPEGMIRNIKHQKYKDFLAENQGKVILKEQDFVMAQEIGKRFANHHHMSKLIKGYHEISLFYWDEKREQLFKTRPDVLNLEKRSVIDLKTSYVCDPFGFCRQSNMFNYQMSVALTEDITRAVFGELFSYIFAVAQTAAPYDMAIYDLPPDWVDNARTDMYRAADFYKENAGKSFEIYEADKGIQTLMPKPYMYRG